MAAVIVKTLTRLGADDRLMTGPGVTFICAEVATVKLEAALNGTASLRSFAQKIFRCSDINGCIWMLRTAERQAWTHIISIFQ